MVDKSFNMLPHFTGITLRMKHCKLFLLVQLFPVEPTVVITSAALSIAGLPASAQLDICSAQMVIPAQVLQNF